VREKMPKKLKGFWRPSKVGWIDELDSSSDEPDTPVLAPLKPKPNLLSGAVALPEPEPEE